MPQPLLIFLFHPLIFTFSCSFILYSFSPCLPFFPLLACRVVGEVKTLLSLILLLFFKFFLACFPFPISTKYVCGMQFMSSSVQPFLHPTIHLPYSNPLFYISLCLHLISPCFLSCFHLCWSQGAHAGKKYLLPVSLLLFPPLFTLHSPSPRGFRFLSPSFLLCPPSLSLHQLSSPPPLPLLFPSILLPSSFPCSHECRW